MWFVDLAESGRFPWPGLRHCLALPQQAVGEHSQRLRDFGSCRPESVNGYGRAVGAIHYLSFWYERLSQLIAKHASKLRHTCPGFNTARLVFVHDDAG